MSHPEITLAEGTIHNPAEPRHFMFVTPVRGHVWIALDGETIAETDAAVRLLEVGYRMYAPVLYLPVDALTVERSRTTRETHCPLKGDCTWYSVDRTGGDDLIWSYEDTFPFAEAIRGRIAFDADRVSVEVAPS